MKKLFVMALLSISLVAMASPYDKKDRWAAELGLTNAQVEAMKNIKQANRKKLKKYKQELAQKRDAEFAKILSSEQMAQLKNMRKKHKKRMVHRKNKQAKRFKKQQCE